MEASALVQNQQAIESSTIAFPRNLLDFNVTLIGTNEQFLNGNDADDGAATLETTKEILEGFLLGGYLNMTAPVLNLTLTQEGRFQLFPGSLIHTFSYSGTLFVWHLESSWNTYKVQRNQEGLLHGKEVDLAERLSSQGIPLQVDSISVATFDESKVFSEDSKDNDQLPTDYVAKTTRPKEDPTTTSTYLIIAIPVAFVALLAFVFYVRRKSSQIKVQKEAELESHQRHRKSEDGEESKVDEDTGSDRSLPSAIQVVGTP
ncbi:MAG: hypothetical protein SGBAC_013036 [Bacillariaceae sp.]